MEIAYDLGSIPIWVTAIGTVFLAFVAALKEEISYWLKKPKLEIFGKYEPPYYEIKDPIVFTKSLTRRSAFINIGIKNKSRRPAKNVQVFISGLNDKESILKNFGLLNLKRAFVQSGIPNDAATLPILFKDVPIVWRLCTLLKEDISKSTSGINNNTLQFITYSSTPEGLRDLKTGTYYVKITATCENSKKPVSRCFKIKYDSETYWDDCKSLNSAFRISRLSKK